MSPLKFHIQVTKQFDIYRRDKTSPHCNQEQTHRRNTHYTLRKITKSRRHTQEDKCSIIYIRSITGNSGRSTTYNAGQKHKNNIEFYIQRQETFK
jgi:hypothetical protein